MTTNHLKIAWRSIIREKRTSLINLMGLSLGIASALILFVIIQHERSYDRFHQNYDRIYRIVTETKRENSSDYNPGVAAPLPQALRGRHASVEGRCTAIGNRRTGRCN